MPDVWEGAQVPLEVSIVSESKAKRSAAAKLGWITRKARQGEPARSYEHLSAAQEAKARQMTARIHRAPKKEEPSILDSLLGTNPETKGRSTMAWDMEGPRLPSGAFYSDSKKNKGKYSRKKGWGLASGGSRRKGKKGKRKSYKSGSGKSRAVHVMILLGGGGYPKHHKGRKGHAKHRKAKHSGASRCPVCHKVHKYHSRCSYKGGCGRGKVKRRRR